MELAIIAFLTVMLACCLFCLFISASARNGWQSSFNQQHDELIYRERVIESLRKELADANKKLEGIGLLIGNEKK